MSDNPLAAELAALRDEVRELRDREVANEIRGLREEITKLRAERAAHVCTCTHLHQTYWPYYQPTVTCGTYTSGASIATMTPVYGESVSVSDNGGVNITGSGYSVSATN